MRVILFRRSKVIVMSSWPPYPIKDIMTYNIMQSNGQPEMVTIFCFLRQLTEVELNTLENHFIEVICSNPATRKLLSASFFATFSGKSSTQASVHNEIWEVLESVENGNEPYAFAVVGIITLSNFMRGGDAWSRAFEELPMTSFAFQLYVDRVLQSHNMGSN